MPKTPFGELIDAKRSLNDAADERIALDEEAPGTAEHEQAWKKQHLAACDLMERGEVWAESLTDRKERAKAWREARGVLEAFVLHLRAYEEASEEHGFGFLPYAPTPGAFRRVLALACGFWPKAEQDARDRLIRDAHRSGVPLDGFRDALGRAAVDAIIAAKPADKAKPSTTARRPRTRASSTAKPATVGGEAEASPPSPSPSSETPPPPSDAAKASDSPAVDPPEEPDEPTEAEPDDPTEDRATTAGAEKQPSAAKAEGEPAPAAVKPANAMDEAHPAEVKPDDTKPAREPKSRRPTAPAGVPQTQHAQSLPSWLIISSFTVGVLLLGVGVALAIVVTVMTVLGFWATVVIIALGGASLSMGITGFITVQWHVQNKLNVTAGGALAVFVLLLALGYYLVPKPPAAGILPRPEEGRTTSRYEDPSSLDPQGAGGDGSPNAPDPARVDAVIRRACSAGTTEAYDAHEAPRMEAHHRACRASVRGDGTRADATGTYTVAHYPDENSSMLYWRLDHDGSPFTECRCVPDRCPPDSIFVEAGTFDYRTEDAAGLHAHDEEEEIAAFCLDRHEVTHRRFRSECDDRSCGLDNDNSRTAPDFAQFCTTLDGEGLADVPVNCVTYAAAAEFCGRVGGRLPRDAEWGWAAAGPEGYEYPWGNTPPTGEHLNYCDEDCADMLRAASHPAIIDPISWTGHDAWEGLAQVGRYQRHASGYWGHLDLAGNVAEWTIWKNGSPALRNGGWLDGEGWRDFTSRWAHPADPTLATPQLGFRCAYDLT